MSITDGILDTSMAEKLYAGNCSCHTSVITRKVFKKDLKFTNIWAIQVYEGLKLATTLKI